MDDGGSGGGGGGTKPNLDNPLGHVSAMNCLPVPELPQGVDMNMSLLQMMTNGQKLPGGGTQLAPGVVAGSSVLGNGGRGELSAAATVCNWGKCLEVILNSEFGGAAAGLGFLYIEPDN